MNATLKRLRARAAGLPLRLFGLGGGLALALALVAAGTAMEVSSRPTFCGSCHIMQPYYQSWLQSSHENVACVDCHIPPGVTAELRKKYEALSMVARYFTGTYGTNPWAEIDDSACLRCHERRLLSGRELFGDVLFDHSAHLAGMRRGKTLRCTSCHSQIVQGSHIAVTTSTCILCHFKGQTAGSGTAQCTLCHQVPGEVIRRGTLAFDHSEVARYGMECTWCHARPAGSDGAVPRERCVTCHNEPVRLARYDDPDLLHRTHVTEHKVDCTHCHLEIQHVGEPHVEQAATSCDACHRAGHSPQLTLYTGIGGRGLDPMPSPMFRAGVRCEGCHFGIPGEEAAVTRASEISCMSCHGPAYRGIYHAWRAAVSERTSGLERQVIRTEREIDRRAAPQSLADARFNLDLVVRGRGVHNVDYAFALLARSHQDMNAARTDRGLAALPLPWAEPATGGACLTCHQGVEKDAGRIFGRAFDHGPHLISARLECDACHRTHEERSPGEVVRFPAAGCDGCHHAGSATACGDCHEGIRSRTVETDRGSFDHRMHLDDLGLSCGDCHEAGAGGAVRLNEETCSGCHG